LPGAGERDRSVRSEGNALLQEVERSESDASPESSPRSTPGLPAQAAALHAGRADDVLIELAPPAFGLEPAVDEQAPGRATEASFAAKTDGAAASQETRAVATAAMVECGAGSDDSGGGGEATAASPDDAPSPRSSPVDDAEEEVVREPASSNRTNTKQYKHRAHATHALYPAHRRRTQRPLRRHRRAGSAQISQKGRSRGRSR